MNSLAALQVLSSCSQQFRRQCFCAGMVSMISGRLIDGIFEIGASNKRMYNPNYSPGTVQSAHVLCKLATFIPTTVLRRKRIKIVALIDPRE